MFTSERNAPHRAGQRLFDIFCEVIFVQILMERLHIIFFILIKIFPYNRYKVICFRNIFFTFYNVTKFFITSGNALKKTPMERLHTFPQVLFCGIIIAIRQEKRRKHTKSFLITFQSFGNIITGSIIAELDLGMLIHKEPSVYFTMHS